MENWEIAETSTDPKELDFLSTDAAYGVRLRVADNENTGVETLDKLSNDSDSSIRWTVADNMSTSIYTLMRLVIDESPSVADKAKEKLKERDVLSDLLGESKCYESFENWRKTV